MNRPFLYTIIGISLSQLWLGAPPAPAAQSQKTIIVTPRDASWMENLAAREVRRYVYLRTGRLLSIVSESAASQKTDAILIGRKDRPLITESLDPESAATLSSLAPQSYWLKTFPDERTPITHQKSKTKHRRLLLTGGDDAGTLYAAYRFAEALGVRFYLHGDVMPDERMDWKLPMLDKREAPLFALRGIQPFHDFPEGPDWWNRDDYLAIIGQLPKLRLNFFGLHTYPEENPNAEPTVWIGLSDDIGQIGKVKFSYPSSYMNTMRGNWGYAPKQTGDYVFGSSGLFERDDFGPELMFGAIPDPETPEMSSQAFERAAALLRDAFGFAHQVGVKTCVGTETPLTIPKLLREHLKALGKNPSDLGVVQELYEGIFRRANQAYPLDYYWFWTPESWAGSGAKEEQIKATIGDLSTVIAAYKQVHPPFALATCGWVLGPQQDRTLFDKVLPKDVAVSCINHQIGYTPVDAGFAKIKGRSKWAIPWLEDDSALTAPQLWAGRMRRDARDALRYGCDGLLGIHWRTRVLSSNLGALAQAAWNQNGWASSYNPPASPEGFPPVSDFYEDWAAHEFGKEAGLAAARVFEKMDCALPKPATWVGGPGGIKPDDRPWDRAQKEYGFVDEFSALRSKVKGNGNLERFDYWLNTFLYFRNIGEVNCAWAEYNHALERVKREQDAAAQKVLARQLALPARQTLVRLVSTLFDHLLATVSTTGELGTVANWNQHNLPDLITRPGEELAKILDEALPPDAQPAREYRGPTRVIVPTKRTSLAPNETLKLKVIVLSASPPRAAALYWRKLGEGRFAEIPLRHLARGVYAVEMPSAPKDDFEYYVKVESEGGQPVCFPASAPALNQTVVVSSE